MTFTCDTFTFFQELDILEIRLTELYPVVDAFVLVEATHTHKGDEKPLYYAANRQRFARWNDKIRHIVVGDLPQGSTQAAIWRREIGQRQAIERGLVDLPDDTIVLVSDLDEIPRREIVASLAQQGMPDDAIYTFGQTLYYYNVNTSCTSLRWNGTRATHLSNIRALTPDGVRWEGLRPRSNEYPRHAYVGDAGWHLSYFGDVKHIQQKMRSFLHQELVSDEHLDPDVIARRMSSGLDIWGREEAQRFTIGPAADLPWAMRADPLRWAAFFHPDWRPVFHEDWYSAEQAAFVAQLAQSAPQEGVCVEIGCWEGRSSACIAQSIAPRVLHCVDHWQGNEDETNGHPATEAAGERDVLADFVLNMERLTQGNWIHYVMDWREWADYLAEQHNLPIAFLHLDASHDYDSVADCLRAVLPFCVEGAILCGDDLYSDGVYRAVHDVLGASVQDYGGRLWVWQKGEV
jgi:beta-1,4-mannosyl-glycoprotein beta-1,4-N-acetylglucosaminyltransferase